MQFAATMGPPAYKRLSLPVSDACCKSCVELLNDELKFILYERFCTPNPRFALPADVTCPLTSKVGNLCGSELNDRHFGLCKFGFSSTIETHDLMVSGFWLPQLRGLGLAAVDERKGLVDFCPTDKRPADVCPGS